MGKPMAKNLLEAGFSLHLWNRTQSKLDAYRDRAKCHTSPDEAVKEADISIIMLENGSVVDHVLFEQQTFKAFKPSSLIIDMSSIPPELAREHSVRLSELGLNYIDAPVSGGTVGAKEASLAIMVGGSRHAFEAAKEVFKALGKATYIGQSGCGQLAKLANQAIVGITIGAVSEALMLAAKGGADPSAVREALSGGFAASRILELHGQRMIEGDYTPGATSRVQLKDMRTILDEAAHQKLTLPLSQKTHDSYLSLVASGNENLDHSGLMVELERLNQTQFRNDT